jgi:tRNA/tmRNA/rRNA uracil-C5-methylase (TrmA/RlmC/RlmD family)
LKYNYFDKLYKLDKLDKPNKKDNTVNPENILQIDYKTVSLDWEKYKCDLGKNVIIANTGYQGLGENLASELGISKSKVIYLISCNETSFQKDFAILEKKYRMDRKIEIRTNYSVWIYKLLLCLY